METEGLTHNVELPCYRDLNTTVKVTDKGIEPTIETVAVETPIILHYDNRFTATAAATPHDLRDFAYGFSFTSGIISSYDQVKSLDMAVEGNTIHIYIQRYDDNDAASTSAGAAPDSPGASSPAAAAAVPDALGASSSAATLGAPSANAATVPNAPHTSAVVPPRQLSPQAIWTISESLLTMQTMHRVTGATHAAVFTDYQGQPLYLREDVGRHNAVDKLIGALLKDNVDPNQGFVFLSSRCALDLVMKCARYGITLVATVSAPTSAVIDFALQEGITLCAYARKKRFTIYTNPQRILLEQ